MSKAAHVSTNLDGGSSFHAVGVRALRVLVIQDGPTEWYAQGLDIDYIAQGESLETVQSAFQDGLCATLKEHLRTYGEISHLLKPAPTHVWDEFYSHATSEGFQLSFLDGHQFDFESEERVRVFSNDHEGAEETPEAPKLATSKKKKLPFDGIQYCLASAS